MLAAPFENEIQNHQGARRAHSRHGVLSGHTEPGRVNPAFDVHAGHCVLWAMLRPLAQRGLTRKASDPDVPVLTTAPHRNFSPSAPCRPCPREPLLPGETRKGEEAPALLGRDVREMFPLDF